MPEYATLEEIRATEQYQRLDAIGKALAKASIDLHVNEGVKPADAAYKPLFSEVGMDMQVVAMFANDQAGAMLRIVVELVNSGADIGASIRGPIAAMWLDGWASGYRFCQEQAGPANAD